MGQQQLLLMVLGIILVGAAIMFGAKYYELGAESDVKDELVSQTLAVGASAQQWFKKPISMGGGGNTFVGFAEYFDSKLVPLKSSPNGIYLPMEEGQESVLITGTPQSDLGYAWTVKTTVYSNKMEILVQ